MRARPSAFGIAIVSTYMLWWNGGTALAGQWSKIRDPSPGSDALLTGVSCVSDETCVATGVATSSNPMIAGWVPIAMSWNGSRWSIRSGRPSSTARSWGTRSRASTRSFCSAVGGLINGEPAAMRWDGTRWSVQRTAFPYPGNPVQLQGVSCVSPRWCASAGWDDVGACTADSDYSHRGAGNPRSGTVVTPAQPRDLLSRQRQRLRPPRGLVHLDEGVHGRGCGDLHMERTPLVDRGRGYPNPSV